MQIKQKGITLGFDTCLCTMLLYQVFKNLHLQTINDNYLAVAPSTLSITLLWP